MMFKYISVHKTSKSILSNAPGTSTNGAVSDTLNIDETVYQTYRELVDPYILGIDKLAWSLLTMHPDSTVR